MRTSRKFNSNSSDVAFSPAPCGCPDCGRILKDDRMALIEREAIRRGVLISVGPRVPLTGAQLELRAARIRRNRAVYTPADEISTCDTDEASA